MGQEPAPAENEETGDAVDVRRPDPVDFHPGRDVLVPSGKKARIQANIAAIKTLHVLEAEDRYATSDEQDVLAQWSGWGAVPEIFDPRRDD